MAVSEASAEAAEAKVNQTSIAVVLPTKKRDFCLLGAEVGTSRTAIEIGLVLDFWYTAKTQSRKFETNIPKKGIAQPQSVPISTFMCL